MLAVTTIVASVLLALPQDGGKTVPATPIKPAPAKAAESQAPVAKLGIGDAAPAFQFDEWIKGDKIAGIEKGKVHVVEFWATWCGPCIAAMPHLSEMQKAHPEVIFLSVAASERGKDESAKVSKVREFVQGKGDVMSYRVVYAGDRNKMSKPWMQAAGQNGIPCAFIVDKDSKVAWIGHPMEMDEPLKQVLAGKWDTAKAKKAFDEEREAEAAQMRLATELQSAQSAGDWNKVESLLREQIAKTGNDSMRMRLFAVLAGPANKPADAWKVGEDILRAQRNNAMMMNQLAWTIVDPEGDVKQPNLGLALSAAEAARDASGGKDGAILDTLARVHFLKGDYAKAIEVQKKAVELAPDGPMKDEMKQTLEAYESKLKKA
jgi:thiol-disulfide isomerase/thioredoxin